MKRCIRNCENGGVGFAKFLLFFTFFFFFYSKSEPLLKSHAALLFSPSLPPAFLKIYIIIALGLSSQDMKI